jgi:hypothetical protein
MKTFPVNGVRRENDASSISIPLSIGFPVTMHAVTILAMSHLPFAT